MLGGEFVLYTKEEINWSPRAGLGALQAWPLVLAQAFLERGVSVASTGIWWTYGCCTNRVAQRRPSVPSESPTSAFNRLGLLLKVWFHALFFSHLILFLWETLLRNRTSMGSLTCGLYTWDFFSLSDATHTHTHPSHSTCLSPNPCPSYQQDSLRACPVSWHGITTYALEPLHSTWAILVIVFIGDSTLWSSQRWLLILPSEFLTYCTNFFKKYYCGFSILYSYKSLLFENKTNKTKQKQQLFGVIP